MPWREYYRKEGLVGPDVMFTALRLHKGSACFSLAIPGWGLHKHKLLMGLNVVRMSPEKVYARKVYAMHLSQKTVVLHWCCFLS